MDKTQRHNMTDKKRSLKVFLIHASADEPKMHELYQYLKKCGVQPWWDRKDMVPGQDMETEPEKMLDASDIAVICLTKNSAKEEGHIQRQIKFAENKHKGMPEGHIFLIPMKLEECDVPRSMMAIQEASFDDQRGYPKLVESLKLRALQLGRATPDEAGFDASKYAETVIRQYENYDLYHSDFEMRKHPIFDHIFAMDLQKTYVQLSARDKDGCCLPFLDEHVDAWLKEKNRGHLVLLGNYGSGKTAFCFQLIHRLLIKYRVNPASGVLPIYMTFRQLRDGINSGNLKETLARLFTDKRPHGYEMRGINQQNVYNILGSPDILLILDGFDEIAASLSTDEIMERFSELKEMIGFASKVLITCRENYLPSQESLEEIFPVQSSRDKLWQLNIDDEYPFEVIRLSHFDRSQQECYLELSVENEQQRSHVLESIRKIPGLPDLASRPILLWMIVQYFEQPPENVEYLTAAHIYSKMVVKWLKDNIGTRFRKKNIPVDEIMRVLEMLAIKLYIGDELIDEYSLSKFLTAYFSQIIPEKISAKEFKYLFEVCTFLMVADGSYGFIHRSFLEFFFARALLHEISMGEGVQFGRAPLFRVVADFLAELAQDQKDRSEVIEKQLLDWIKQSREETSPEYEYLGGNSAALLCRLGFQFGGLDLSGVKLKHADLRNGDFQNCNLSKANLDGSNLSRTNFSGSNLQHAVMDNTFMEETLFRDVDFQSASLKNIRMIGGPPGIFNAAFSPDKHYIVIGTSKGQIIVVPYPAQASPNAEFTRIDVNKSDILHFCFSADGEYLAVTDRSRLIYIYSWPKIIAGEKQEPRKLAGNDDYVRWLQFAPDQPVLMSAGRDHCVKLWNLGTDPVHVKSFRHHKKPVMCVAWQKNTHYVASCGYDFDAYFWSIDRDKVDRGRNLLREKPEDKHTHNHIVREITYNSTGNVMATSGEIGEGYDLGDFIKLWDVGNPASPKFLRKMPIPDEVFNLAFVDEDKILIAGSGIYGKLLRYNPANGELVDMKKAHQDYIRSFSIHKDDNLLLTSSWDGTVKLWRLDDLSLHSTVFEIEGANAAMSYGVGDAFLGAKNITNLLNISERWINFFIELGAENTGKE